jgi:hypothetical protein
MAALKDAYEARMARLASSKGVKKEVKIPTPLSTINVLLSESPGLKLGSTTWEGAHILSQQLPSYLGGLSASETVVLELGAGTGLCGLTAALLGCSCLLTDKKDEVTGVMNNSVELNKGNIEKASGRCDVAELSWGDDFDVDAALRWCAAAKQQQMSSVPKPVRSLDLVLAADVVYHRDLTSPLVATIARLIPLKSSVRMLMAYRERGAGAAFFQQMSTEGFDIAVLDCSQRGHLPGLRTQTFMDEVLTEAELASMSGLYHSSDEHVILEISRRQAR